MIIIGTFRGLKSVIILNPENGFIVQKENFKNSKTTSLYTVTSEIFSENDIETLICSAYSSDFFETLESIVYANENWSGSITGTRDEMLNDFRREPEVLVALDLFVNSRMNFDRKEIVSL